MRLIKNEFKKVFGAKTVTALVAVLIFASALTCFYFTGGEKPAYSAEEEAVIKRFYAEYSTDAEAFAAFDSARKKAASDIAEEIIQKYSEDIEKAGDDKKRYRKQKLNSKGRFQILQIMRHIFTTVSRTTQR